MRTSTAFVVISLLLTASPARAQKWEASGIFAFTPASTVDRRAAELTDQDIRGAFTWGFQGARFLTPKLGAEVIWTQQATALEIGTADGKADLFTMNVRQLFGNAVYQLGHPEAKWRPFVFGGLGATFFSADTVESETKFAFDVGGGVKWLVLPGVYARGHVSYKPTFMKDTGSGDFCDPFGFCQGTLQRFEFAGAVTLQF